jgi:DNA-binding FadR family transcriptional regulator
MNSAERLIDSGIAKFRPPKGLFTVNDGALKIQQARMADIGRIAGTMDTRGIMGTVVKDLGCRIVSGEWKSGDVLPTEAELIVKLQVSRSVVREAMRILNAKGLVRGRPMAGTKVLPRSDWRLLDPDIIQWRILAADRKVLLTDLLHVRLALEPGVARLATESASPAARARITAAWQGKVAVLNEVGGSPQEQRARFILADLEFHRAFLAAVDSEILSQLFAVIEAALGLLIDLQMQAKGSTTELVGMEQSMELHENVYAAFAANDAQGAEISMRRLIERAIIDANEGFKLLE